MTPDPRGGVMRMLASSVFFCAMALFVGEAHRLDPHLSTFVSSGVRAIVGMILLLGMARADLRALRGDGRWELWMRGVLGSVALITYFASLQIVGVGEAGFLNQTSAVWVAVLAPLVLAEPTGWATGVAVVASMVGIGLLAHPGSGTDLTIGRVEGLVSGISAAGAYLAVRRAGASNSALTVVFYFSFVSCLMSAGGFLLSGASLPTNPWVILLLCGSGVAAGLGQLFMTEAYRRAPAALASAAAATTPLLNVVAGWVFLGQVPDTTGRIGMLVLLLTTMALPFATPRRPASKQATAA